MYIKKVEVKNFRLLKDVTLTLEEKTTVIVGRNNSGKTSLTEFFRRLLSDNSPSFALVDFPLVIQQEFWDAFVRKSEGVGESETVELLPTIEAKITIVYDPRAHDLGLLSDFIIDLDINSKEAIALISYKLKDGKINALFENLTYMPDSDLPRQKRDFFRSMKERIPKLYVASLSAVDPTDDSNQKSLDLLKLRSLLQAGFINAQRGLDDTTHKERDVLGKVFERLLTSASAETAAADERTIALALERAVQGIQSSIDSDFNEQLNGLLPAFSIFGYPGLNDPHLCTETILDVQRLLENNTRIRYANSNGVSLPETHNGLGSRNLIFILLQLYEFFKCYKGKQLAPGVHLIFIEEPEAHLHPQMQEVFIRKLSELANVFSELYNEGESWPVQFIVTTHSTHMANEAPFEAIRYFLSTRDDNKYTLIKDLRSGLRGESWEQDREFLHKYLTLTRCDLFFADKAIMIEGPTERLLMPKLIEKVEGSLSTEQKLSCQYVSIIEVGGAYAHHFFKLLDFLELRTLIITDMDSVKEGQSQSGRRTYPACKVAEGTRTSNACIKKWFQDDHVSPDTLIGKLDAEKIDGFRRIAYEVPESQEATACGRSFEDAFMLANRTLFHIQGINEAEVANDAWNKAENIDKTDFALKYAIESTAWNVPRYIKEGLIWLSECVSHPATAREVVGQEEVDHA
ncbi:MULTISPECIES: ATP-dependent nuclease [Pelosinus]|uniref:Uncharacterized protein n=1 Tax=Pelosinus fermentans B4 TaxID=1149862 RepID=I9L643_9FIRM|nr:MULTISPECIES: ATP-dependent endonuclease [Pelosinus]EIW15716.1 hypothetical protein FB4_1405 [Pelosinus fermentans B4]EIW26594.1 hypothetical protein FA11_1598 [Pelosinus fermentans A11]